MKRPVLQIVRGVPGTGKSTWARDHFPGLILENDYFHCHSCSYEYNLDKMKEAMNFVRETAERALSLGMDVCIANTFTRKKYVDFYKGMAEKYNANFRVVRMMHEFGNVHNVPGFVLENMKTHFEDYPGELHYNAKTDEYFE